MATFGRRKGEDQLAVALATGASCREAAESAQTSERTASRLMGDPLFKKRVEVLRAALVERALCKMTDAMTDAAETLRNLLHAKSEAVRLGASRSILELTIRLRETVELERRVAGLEASSHEPA